MSIATELTRIANAKAAIKTAINAKGGTLTNELLGSYASAINALTVGGSGSSGSSASFYKCASVGSGTWTGYKAVLSSGVYSFESSLTSDSLTFSSVTPVVDGVYSADALIKANLYTGWEAPSGAIFYASFTSDTATPEVGGTMERYDVTYVSDSTLGCTVAQFSEGRIYASASSFPTGANPWSVSAWVCPTDSSNMIQHLIGVGDANHYWNHMAWCYVDVDVDDGEGASFATHGPSGWGYQSGVGGVVYNTWSHYVYTYDGSYIRIYKDGSLVATSEQHTLDTYSVDKLSIGSCRCEEGGEDGNRNTGKMSSYRIYARALTQAEVTTLYQEH